MSKFKVGDIVEAFGVRGVVTNDEMGIRVKFGDDTFTRMFNPDGRIEHWHLVPSLKLIERPKKKVKKTISRWGNVHSDGTVSFFFSKENADKTAYSDRIACVQFKGEYEVEEE